MIGEALKSILATGGTLTDLIGERVYPSIVPLEVRAPSLYFLDDNLQPQACRVPDGSFTGQMEIGIMAESFEEVYAGLKALRKVLDNYSGTAAGVALSLNRGQSLEPSYLNDTAQHVQSLVYQVNGQTITELLTP